MKKLLLLAACLLALQVSPVHATPAGDPEIVVVRICETYNAVQMVITRATGQNEVREFRNGTSDKALTASAEGYFKALQALYKEGYSLQSTFTAALGASTSTTTLLFVKAPKP